MQSEQDSLCGEVVLDSFNIAFRDEDNIFDQMNQKAVHFDL